MWLYNNQTYVFKYFIQQITLRCYLISVLLSLISTPAPFKSYTDEIDAANYLLISLLLRFVASVFNASVDLKLIPFNTNFNLEKKSHGTRSGKYGRYSNTEIPLPKTS